MMRRLPGHQEGKRRFQATSFSAAWDANVQGMSSSIFALGWALTIFVSVSANQACGSISFSLHVSTSDAIVAQFSPPPSEPGP